MLLARIILGGMLAVALGQAPSAEVARPEYRPVNQTDAWVFPASLVMPAPLFSAAHVLVQTGAALRPLAREDYLPAARWDSRDDGAAWTRATLTALTTEAAGLDDVIPRDITIWCPTYAANPPEMRRAFWVGLMSALARHESTLNPRAVGGGGQWFGLLQISPPTARHYQCEARTGEALRDPEANLACAARIMAVTVARDQAVAIHDSRWRGVAADWGPMTRQTKRAEMAAWTRAQPYCQPVMAVRTALRPVARPVRDSADLNAVRLAKL